MKKNYKYLLLALSLSFVTRMNAQIPSSPNLYASIKKYNLSKLWRADQIQIEGNGEKIGFPEPMGFIGDNFQRFYIHYLSVTKSAANPYVYNVKGKTRVKDNICDFTGTITVSKTAFYEGIDDPDYKQGVATCRVEFYEDSTQAGSGFIKGTLTTGFCLDKTNNISYDAIMFVADGFSNNECEASWTSYKTHKSKKCNWGDYRIPASGDLDVGAGEFIVNEKYIQFGWQTYTEASGVNEILAEKALKIESKEWWR